MIGSGNENLFEIDTFLSYEGEGLEDIAAKLRERPVKLPLYLR